MAEKHLKLLSRLTQNHDLSEIHQCIEDLVVNGLRPERFSVGENHPNRQEITQYLASWCRMVGLSQEECTEWLVDYCQEALAPLSHSGLSQVRHSTKSNRLELSPNRFFSQCARIQNSPWEALEHGQSPRLPKKAWRQRAQDMESGSIESGDAKVHQAREGEILKQSGLQADRCVEMENLGVE